MTQMEQWSILSNMLNYVQHSKFNSIKHSLSVKPVNRYKIKPDEGNEFREVDFGTILENLQEEYLDVYEGIQSDIVSSSRFDENFEISTTYLGRVEHRGKSRQIKGRRIISYIRKWIYLRQIVRWYRVPVTVRHRC